MKFLYKLLLLSAIMSPVMADNAITENDLVKVTSGANVKCVTYYIYKKALYCNPKVSKAEPVDPHLKDEEKLNIVFDDRPWQIAWGNKDKDSTTIEYVPLGDDINNWNELITSQFFPGLQDKVTPRDFADRFVQKLKDDGYTPVVTFLKNSPDQVVYEYRIDKPENQIQDEMQMITVDNKGMYILHYVIKKFDMGQSNREKWLKNLSDTTIK